MLWIYRILAVTLLISRFMIIYENYQRIKERKKFQPYEDHRKKPNEY